MKPPEQLSPQAIEEFKAVYRDEFGRVISDDEAREIAFRLLRFFGVLTRPQADESENEVACGQKSR